MAFMALLMNVIVWQYALGVVRSALDEGVRIGAPSAATHLECQAAIDRVMTELVGGPLGEGVVTSCMVGGELVVATAQGSLASWFPFVTDLTVLEEVVAVKESDA